MRWQIPTEKKWMVLYGNKTVLISFYYYLRCRFYSLSTLLSNNKSLKSSARKKTTKIISRSENVYRKWIAHRQISNDILDRQRKEKEQRSVNKYFSDKDDGKVLHSYGFHWGLLLEWFDSHLFVIPVVSIAIVYVCMCGSVPCIVVKVKRKQLYLNLEMVFHGRKMHVEYEKPFWHGNP